MTREELLKIAKPVLFNTEMVRAILEDRKTATRRLTKGNIILNIDKEHKVTFLPQIPRKDRGREIKSIKYLTLDSFIAHEAPYQPGDILYVRETFVQAAAHIFWYKADNKDFLSKCKTWKPSIHMPKEAARIFLKVKDVRVERLQDMSWDDICSEGIVPDSYIRDSFGFDMLRGKFCELWNSTIKKSDLARYSWGANPWVWVIEFERIEPDSEV